ncbi:MAG: ABC transporter substrate-binding protein [Bacteroidaceae bacterium]|nr:ABC transporter substrate-binding protein [Bacteroidaceae bacterium]
MKQITRFLLTASLLLAVPFAHTMADNDRDHILKVYNWADYIDEDLIPEFEQWYQENTGQEIHVIYQTFDINEVMLTKIETGHEDYDVVCPSEYIIERMLKNGMLLPLDRDFGSVPDYTQNVSPFATEQFNRLSTPDMKASDYAVGFMWGTTGILYNTDYVSKEEAETWGILWNPRLENRILMKDAVRDVYGSVMLYLRKNEIAAGTITREQVMNDATYPSLKLFEDTINCAKKNFAGWEVDFGKERMIQEKAWVNLTWSGDAMWALEEVGDAVNLDYVVPKEGSNVWFDGWVIPIYAKNVKAANWFINFMCMSENAMRNMDAIGYVSVIGTRDILESKIDDSLEETVNLSYFFGEGADSVKVSPVQYPDATIIRRCALMHDAGNRTEAMLDMWSRVKGDSLNIGMIVVLAIAISAILILFLQRSINRDRQNKRRGKAKKTASKHSR